MANLPMPKSQLAANMTAALGVSEQAWRNRGAMQEQSIKQEEFEEWKSTQKERVDATKAKHKADTAQDKSREAVSTMLRDEELDTDYARESAQTQIQQEERKQAFNFYDEIIDEHSWRVAQYDLLDQGISPEEVESRLGKTYDPALVEARKKGLARDFDQTQQMEVIEMEQSGQTDRTLISSTAQLEIAMLNARMKQQELDASYRAGQKVTIDQFYAGWKPENIGAYVASQLQGVGLITDDPKKAESIIKNFSATAVGEVHREVNTAVAQWNRDINEWINRGGPQSSVPPPAPTNINAIVDKVTNELVTRGIARNEGDAIVQGDLDKGSFSSNIALDSELKLFVKRLETSPLPEEQRLYLRFMEESSPTAQRAIINEAYRLTNLGDWQNRTPEQAQQ